MINLVPSSARCLLIAALSPLWLTIGQQYAKPQPPTRATAVGDDSEILSGDFWKEQGLTDILSPWTNHARDREHGAFYSFLNKEWEPFRTQNKYPGMVGRHLFSYSSAYLMTGDQQHLDAAEKCYRFMIEHGWDEEFGGWYEVVDRSGRVIDDSKGLFMQIYAITGLAMYYAITHDAEVLKYIEHSNRILEEHAWDKQYGGYVRALKRDLSVRDATKDFTPQLAPLSGYLGYLNPVTRDEVYLKQSQRLMDVALEHMQHEKTGWILERFDRAWEPRFEGARSSDTLSVGHNIETAWMLLRLHALTGEPRYRAKALRLADRLLAYAFDDERGVWYHKMQLDDPSLHPETAVWWVQAYGDMFLLYMYRTTHDDKYLRQFKKSARYWNDAFIDHQRGGAFLRVTLDGKPERAHKAVRSKTSYHSMEHSLLAYLYLNLWVRHEPVTLHFCVEDPHPGERLYALPIEDFAARIKSVELNDKPWNRFNADEGYVVLPPRDRAKIKVVIHSPHP